MIRPWLKTGTANLLSGTGLDRALRPAAVPVVVGYHRVVQDFDAAAATSIPSMLVTVRMLERHLDWIGRRYRFTSVEELEARAQSGDADRFAAVTFDDGYQDYYDCAFPLLQRKGIPSAIFVVTDHIGTARVHVHDRLYLLLARRRTPWNPGRAAKIPNIAAMSPYDAMRALVEGLPLSALTEVVGELEEDDPLPEDMLAQFRSLSWEALARIRAAGHTVGSHTRTHILMTNEDSGRIRGEAAISRAVIKSKLGGDVHHFAYPSGCFNDAAVEAVAEAGYRFGYTTCSHRSPSDPWLTIPRTLLWEHSSLNSVGEFSGAVLNCQIHHAFEWITGCRQSHLTAGESQS